LEKFPILRLFQEFLRANGALAALMSGSGSTTFAICENVSAARIARGKIQIEIWIELLDYGRAGLNLNLGAEFLQRKIQHFLRRRNFERQRERSVNHPGQNCRNKNCADFQRNCFVAKLVFKKPPAEPRNGSGNDPAEVSGKSVFQSDSISSLPNFFRSAKNSRPTLQMEVAVLAIPSPPCRRRHDERGGQNQIQRKAQRC
jgi:hypothetical protein